MMKMYLQKVISKITLKKNNFLLKSNVWKVSAKNSRIRIQIHWSEVWIHGSAGSVPKFHASATLLFTVMVGERGDQPPDGGAVGGHRRPRHSHQPAGRRQHQAQGEDHLA
jgi:hypothetical protein